MGIRVGERARLEPKTGMQYTGGAAAGRTFCFVGGALQRAPPRSGAYARQEAPVRALKTHLRCNFCLKSVFIVLMETN